MTGGLLRAFLTAVIFAMLAPGTIARAETLPALYRVVGVAADDVLNIRAAPGAGAAILGAIAPGTEGVEVIALSETGAWGQVGTGEGNGWVAMRYLRPQRVATGAAPPPFLCYGTEPFWNLNSGATVGTQSGRWNAPDEGPQSLMVLSALDFSDPRLASLAGDTAWFAALAGKTTSGATEIFSLSVTRGACSDGMSDRVFGFEALIARQTKGAAQTYSGCCTRDQR